MLKIKEILIKKLVNWKEFISSLVLILLCLLTYTILSTEGALQKALLSLFAFFIIPAFFIRKILKQSLLNFGLNMPKKRSDLFWSIGLLATYLAIGIFLIKFSPIKDYYITYGYTFWFFIFYELVAFNFIYLLQEFFFKGFVFFTFSLKLKYWSILIIPTIYFLLLLSEKTSLWQSIPLLIISLGGSFLTYKSKSIWPSYLTGLIFIIILDASLIYILK